MVIYEDEYNNVLHQSATGHIAAVGDTAVISGDEWKIKSRVFYPEQNAVVLTVTQYVSTTMQTESNDTDRLRRVNSAIIAINSRQDANEKKTKILSEQIVTVRKHINQRIQQEKKDQND